MPPAGLTCAVCLDVPRQPVVTRCGHLLCWQCLLQWEAQERRNGFVDGLRIRCPVCKGGVNPHDTHDVHPILGAGDADAAPSSSPHPAPPPLPTDTDRNSTQGAYPPTPPPAAPPPPPPAAPPRPERAEEPRVQGFGLPRQFAPRLRIGVGTLPFVFFTTGVGGFTDVLTALFVGTIALVLVSNFAPPAIQQRVNRVLHLFFFVLLPLLVTLFMLFALDDADDSVSGGAEHYTLARTVVR